MDRQQVNPLAEDVCVGLPDDLSKPEVKELHQRAQEVQNSPRNALRSTQNRFVKPPPTSDF